jgi:hypothetical protein
MENEEKPENEERQAGEQVQTERRQDNLKGISGAGIERALGRLKTAIWILAILTAVICASSVVNVVIAKKSFEGVQRHLTSIGELKESLKEIQNTSTELKKMIEDLSETEEEEGIQGDPAQIWNGKI